MLEERVYMSTSMAAEEVRCSNHCVTLLTLNFMIDIKRFLKLRLRFIPKLQGVNYKLCRWVSISPPVSVYWNVLSIGTVGIGHSPRKSILVVTDSFDTKL